MFLKKLRCYLKPILYILTGILIGYLLRGLFAPKENIVCQSLNATYLIDGCAVTLTDGKCLAPVVPGQEEMMLTSVNYLPARGELSGDKRDDAAVILMTKTPDGAMCQYVTAAIGKRGGALGTNAVYLGGEALVLDMAVEDGMIWLTLEEGASGVEVERQYVYRDGKLLEVG